MRLKELKNRCIQFVVIFMKEPHSLIDVPNVKAGADKFKEQSTEDLA